MIAKNIASLFKTNLHVIERHTEGLSQEDSLMRPAFRGNCLNWVLGHMLVTRNVVLKMLDLPTVWDKDQIAAYRYESSGLTKGETAVELATILSSLQTTQTTILAAIESLTDEQLHAKLDDTTLGERLNFFAWHEAYHAGQTELLRQVCGVNDHII